MTRPPLRPATCGLALAGLFAFVFAALALSGPGRIDIDDGQLRFEVAQNLVDHGEPTIRDPGLWFTVLPGRNGMRYSMCRFPHSLLGAGSVLVSDATGPVSEGRRHFFFALIGALAGAGLAVTYAAWFGRLGSSLAAALGWGAAGVFCTPAWYYSTSTFDDILGAGAVVLAVVVAFLGRRRPLAAAAAAGMLIGWAFNCKQPLGLFLLPVLGALYEPGRPLRAHLGRFTVALAGVGLGLILYVAYEWYKFPPETRAAHIPILERWRPTWSTNPVPAILGLIVSPGAGALWYCPAVLLGAVGLAGWFRCERWLTVGVIGACVSFFAFICALAPFKGDLAWGPRYLTPIFAVLWLFVPTAAAAVRRRVAVTVLVAGLLVQVLGLSLDPHRLYLQRNLWSRFYVVQPWLYFEPAIAHLFNRPRELVEVLAFADQPGQEFTPARAPTYCLPILERTPGGPAAIRQYAIYSTLRPWWISQQHLAPKQRPVTLWPTFWLLLMVAAGSFILVLGCCLAYSEGPLTAVAGGGGPGKTQLIGGSAATREGSGVAAMATGQLP